MEYASKTEAINGADNTKIMTPLRVKQSILANSQSGGITEETDPIFKSSPAYNITQENINNWNNNTYTAGTGINISSDNVISNTITNTSQLNNDNNFINEIKTINGQSLIGQGDIIIEGGTTEEADPVFTNSPASTITQNDIEKWNSFSGGDLSYDIKPPADYTTADTDRISSIMLGDITPTTEDYAKYDLNGDGVIDILDLRICRKLIEYNLKSSVPGRIIIDASDYLKPIKIINSNNEIIASLGVYSSTRDLEVNGEIKGEGVETFIKKDTVAVLDNVVSRNLLNLYNFQSQTINGVTFTKNKDNSITINGTATSSFGVNFVKLKLKAGTYHLSLNETVPNDFYIYDYDTNTGIISNNSTATLTQDYNNVGFDTWINSGTTLNNVTIYPQLEEGSTATDYVPYLNLEEAMKENEVYSTSEVRVGTWFGKPLYRKIIHLTSGWELGQEKIINHNISNIDKVIYYKGVYRRSDKTDQIIPNVHSNMERWGSSCYDFNNTTFTLYIGTLAGIFSIENIDITLEYTKTTD